MVQFGLSRLNSLLRPVIIGTLAATLGIGGSAALAQDATPVEINPAFSIRDTNDSVIGEVEVWEADGMVTMYITVEGLTPGEHGMHIHEGGVCDPTTDPPFDSAGGHFNPDMTVHGPGEATLVADSGATPVPHEHGDDAESHAGDLGNLTVAEDGTASVTVSTSSVTLESGAANSLADGEGTALVIHADADDLMTDPSGNSGDRIGCAVLFGPNDVATPISTPLS